MSESSKRISSFIGKRIKGNGLVKVVVEHIIVVNEMFSSCEYATRFDAGVRCKVLAADDNSVLDIASDYDNLAMIWRKPNLSKHLHCKEHQVELSLWDRCIE